MEITRTALVLFPATQMYELVADVASYPQFLSWCTASRLIATGDNWQVASLDISIAGMRQSFTTRNQLSPGESLSMELLEGPFQQLYGEWRFEPRGPGGSKILLQLEFEFGVGLLSAAFAHGFAGVADKLVNDFCVRAEDVYGSAGDDARTKTD